MSMVATLSAGSWTPTYGSGGVTSAYGASRQYRDGVFVRTVFLNELAIQQRLNNLVILKNSGQRVTQVTNRKGQRYTLPTKTAPGVSDLNVAFTTQSFTFPDYAATDAVTQTGDNFTKTLSTGNSILGIPVPLQRINEGEVELLINQQRGLALSFTKEYLETSLLPNPSQHYAELTRYALDNDTERYAWLACLFTGPITETADDFGTLFNDAIGITNKASYTLTRTLSSIGAGSNLITAQTTGTAPGMNNSGNSRFGSTPINVPWLFGSTAADITYSTISRLSEKWDGYNIPIGKRNLFFEAKGYNDVAHLPQFINEAVAGGGGAEKFNEAARIGGRIHGFNVFLTNVIQPCGSSSNVLYELALADDTLAYGIQREPTLIIDNMLDKKEMAIVVLSTTRYGVTAKRPDHMAIVQTRTRV